MDKLINYLMNLNFYTDNLNKEDIYLQYKFNVLDKEFKLVLLWKDKNLNFYRLNEFVADKDIHNIVIADLFDKDYYITYIDFLITLINEDTILNDFINTKYFTFPAFKTRTDVSKYYSKLTNQNKKEIYNRLKEKINY